MSVALLFVLMTVGHASVLHHCSKLFNPQHYLDQLPSLSLPYINSLPIPSQIAPEIKPSPVITTKVINVVTKYVTKNPMCIRVTGNKPRCKAGGKKSGFEFQLAKKGLPGSHYKTIDDYQQKASETSEDLGVQASESPRAFQAATTPTPSIGALSKQILIEDRLDHLEAILPHYTRRRVYETSTITVTKVRRSEDVTATLLVKNCVPRGIDVCPAKSKKRKSKVAKYTNVVNEIDNGYFG